MNFAKSSATVRTSSLEHVAQRIARNDTKAIVNTQSISPDILNSMEAQGMMNMNAWGPGTPIDPVRPIGEKPRQFEYMIGQNIVQRPRSTEAISFDTMRNVIEMYDVAQMAIEVRQDELRNLDWDIVPEDERDFIKYESEINQVRSFFTKPDGHMLFDDFQNMIAYDWLAFDCLTIFPHLTKGGKLGALEPVDGTTITPLVDYYGRIPEAPAPSFVQWTYGMPWLWLDRNQLIYKPHRRRSNKLYGFSPIEWLLNNINTDIRYQLYFLQYFTEGSVPETWINVPETLQGPDQIKKFQEMYDTVMSGNQAQKHKVKFIPFGSQVKQAKDTVFDVHFPHYLLTKTCAAFKVTPAELGFTEKVNKSSGESQEDVQFRRSIRPSAIFFQNLYNSIIHQYFGFTNLRFKYMDIDEQENMLIMAQRDKIYASIGVISPDEIRTKRLGLDIDLDNPVPRMFITESAATPIQDAIKQAQASIQQMVADTQSKTGETPHQQQETEDVGVENQLREELETANKARMDFFVSPAGRKQESIPIQRSKRG